MKFKNIFLWLLFLTGTLQPQLSWASDRVQAGVKNNNKIENPWFKNLNLSAKIFRQADAVAREMWWVAANVRRPLGSSPFGRMQRASLKEAHAKLLKGVPFKCDNYSFKKLSPEMRPLKVEIYASCNVKNPSLLATWVLDQEDQIHIDFYPVNLSEELGLVASVMNKKTHCDLHFKGFNLKSMNCQNWAQDRSSTEVVDLSTFIFKADQDSLLQIKGIVLEGLNPKSKIDSRVPLTGRIIVTESEIKEKKVELPDVAVIPAAHVEPEGSVDANGVPQEGSPATSRHRRKLKTKPNAEVLPEPEYIEGQDPTVPVQEIPQAEPSER